MEITPFELEAWYTKYEFTSKYNLSASGIKPLSINDLNVPADFMSIPLGYLPVTGSTELKEKISQIYNSSPEEILITNGAIEAIFLIQMALINPGDKVITLKPVYPALYQVAKDIGAEIIEWKLEYEDSFKPDIGRLKKLMEKYQPKLLIINFPNNPTSITINQEQTEDIILLARQNNCYLVADEIYHELSYKKTFSPVFKSYHERGISISSLSKAYGLPGLRIGWIIAEKEIIKKCLNLRLYTTLCSNFTGEKIATIILKERNEILESNLEHAKHNFQLISPFLEKWKNDSLIDYVEPQAGVMIFIKLNNVQNTEPFCIEFEKEYSILLLPGIKYGNEYKQFFRLGFGGEPNQLLYCMEKLEQFLYKSFFK